jgi:hypothetical protein
MTVHIDAILFRRDANDLRVFSGSNLYCIDTAHDNKLTSTGKIGDNDTFKNIPANFKEGVDAVMYNNDHDIRLFKSDQLVVIDALNGNAVTYDGKISNHPTFKNLP